MKRIDKLEQFKTPISLEGWPEEKNSGFWCL